MGAGFQYPVPGGVSPRLRLGGKRRSEEAEGEGDEEHNETGPHESFRLTAPRVTRVPPAAP
jgi:hypothetical protein